MPGRRRLPAAGLAAGVPAADHSGRSSVMPGQELAAGPRTLAGVSERSMSGPGITTSLAGIADRLKAQPERPDLVVVQPACRAR